ncbi:MAG: 50S ribosomal protein L4 [Actinomycetota bacterium]|nr:50S ribosomal protein L4 [Actinomycetota bacterium]
MSAVVPRTSHRAPVQKDRPAPVSRSVERRDMHGASLGEVQLAPEVFGIRPNLAVLHQVVTAQLAAARAGTQSTKTRAEVSGGGSKPWRQKGTGRARQGSTRSPIWKGGGVALGPKPRSYAQRTPKKMVRLALRSALSDRASESKVALVDAWRFEVPRTKDAIEALDALGLRGRVLVVVDREDVTAERSFANLPEVQTVLASELSAYDVLRHDWVVFTDATLPMGEAPPSGTVTTETSSAASPAAPSTASHVAPAEASEAAPSGVEREAMEEEEAGEPVDGDAEEEAE